MKEKPNILSNSIFSLFIRYCSTSILTMMFLSIYILIDVLLIARGVGQDGVAALNIVIPIYTLLFSTSFLFGVGGSILFSTYRGRKCLRDANTAFTHALFLSLMMGTTYSILGLLFQDKILTFLGTPPSLYSLTKDYLTWLAPFSLLFVITHTLAPFIRNDHAPIFAMTAISIGCVSNILLDYLFIFHWSFGIKGASMATSCSTLLTLCILLTHFLKPSKTLQWIWTPITHNSIQNILHHGVPSFITEISAGIVVLTFNRVLLQISDTIALSAYGIIVNTAFIGISLFLGIGQGLQPLLSENYGANHKKRLYQIRNLGLITVFIFGLLLFGFGFYFSPAIVSLFGTPDASLLHLTVHGMRLYFLVFIFAGLNIVFESYFQSSGSPTLSLLISLHRGLIFVVLFLFTLPNLFQIQGAWLSVPLSECTTLLLLLCYFFWRKIAKCSHSRSS